MKKLENAEIKNILENKEKRNKIAKEIAHVSISAVAGGLVGGIVGASIQKAGGYTKAANAAGYLVGLTSTVATSWTVYEKLQRADEIQQKQLEFLNQTLVSYKEEDLLYDEEDLEEGGENEEA